MLSLTGSGGVKATIFPTKIHLISSEPLFNYREFNTTLWPGQSLFPNDALAIMFVGAGVDAVNRLGGHKSGTTQGIRAGQNAGGFDSHRGDIFDLLGGRGQGDKAVILHVNSFGAFAVGINITV